MDVWDKTEAEMGLVVVVVVAANRDRHRRSAVYTWRPLGQCYICVVK